MRAAIAIVVSLVLGACSKGENAGAEEAKKQAEAELKAQVARGESAKKISPPVPGQTKIPCEQLIDAAAFTSALGETEPMTVKDKQKDEPEAVASCSLVRGGARPSPAEQAALLKKNGKLGVIPGDPVCVVTAYCWTIETPERFKTKCHERKDADDESMGSYACKQTVMVGAFDVFVYSFFDEDTKCIIKAQGGPSNTDNEVIRKCAIAARDGIGPAQIAVGGAAPAAPAAPAGSGSAQ
jgi:hypothetical protein